MYDSPPEYYGIKQDTHGRSLKDVAEIIIAKHRNGKTGDVRLRFIGDYAKFTNIEDAVPLPGEEDGRVFQSRMNSAPLPPDDPLSSITQEDQPPF